MVASVIFVCGTPTGGALDSTIELARCGRAHGHDVEVVVAAGDAYRSRRRLHGALVRLERLSARVGAAAWRLHDRFLDDSAPAMFDDVAIWRARDVVATASHLAGSDRVFVVNSVRRLDLRRLVDLAERTSAPVAWYLRETSSLAFVAEFGSRVELLVANSQPLADEARRRSGRPCAYLPSAVALSGLRGPDERTTLLMVNPVPSHGLDIVIQLADAVAPQPVVLQESWPLSDVEVEGLQQLVGAHTNLLFRRRSPRSELFRDTRLLLAPHEESAVGLSRPRVVIEAQAVGIPVIASDLPGLAAAVADASLLVAHDASVDSWVAAVARANADYVGLCSRAAEFSRRELRSAEELWSELLALLGLV